MMLKNITCPDITIQKRQRIKEKWVYTCNLNLEYINNNIDLVRFRDHNFKNYDDKIKETFKIVSDNDDVFTDD